MKTILAMEISNSLSEGLAIRYNNRKTGKKRKRNVSDVRSMVIANLVEAYSKMEQSSIYFAGQKRSQELQLKLGKSLFS